MIFFLGSLLSQLKNPPDTPDNRRHCAIPFLIQQPSVFHTIELQKKIKKVYWKKLREGLPSFNQN